MAKIRVPGVYFESNIRRQPTITLGETGVPAFLGVAQRGPMWPVKINSFEQFKDIYGRAISGSYLSSSIEGFFENGGNSCFVLRVAHLIPGREGEELARRAFTEVLDRVGYPSLRFAASSEGEWGNDISLKINVPKEPRIKTTITYSNLAPEDCSVSLVSCRGFEVGMLICLFFFEEDENREKYLFGSPRRSCFVTINKIHGNEIFWANPIGKFFPLHAPTHVVPVEFEVQVFSKEKKEYFPHLSLSKTSPRNIIRVINQESRLIRVASLSTNLNFPDALPENIENIFLKDGTNGLNELSPIDFIGYNEGPGSRFGLGSLEDNDEVDLIIAPGLHFASKNSSKFKKNYGIRVVHQAMIEHCEKIGEHFAILDLPENTRIEEAIDWRIQFDSSFGALFFPWLVKIDNNRRKNIPPSGHIAGLMSKCDRTEGVHRAAANIALNGVVDTSIVLREEHLSELNAKSINCIRSFPIRGTRPWGARTLSNDPLWRYIPTRRIFNAIKRAIHQNTQWVVFENNNAALRRYLKSTVEGFLRNLWSAGYFKGETQQEAFFVSCNEENNPRENIDNGLLMVDIGIAPIRPAEFISLTLEHTMEDRTVGDLENTDY